MEKLQDLTKGKSIGISEYDLFGELVDTTPLHTAKEEHKHRLIETIERYTPDEHKAVVMNCVKELLEL